MPPQKATKRKAATQIPQDDEQPTKSFKRQQTNKSQPQPEKSQQDFGSAFAALLAAPTPAPAPTPTPDTTTTSKPTSKTNKDSKTTPTTSKTDKNGKNIKADAKGKDDKKNGKGKDEGRGKKDKEDDEGISGQFNSIKNKRQTNAFQPVITVSREDSEKQRLAKQFSKLQKSREKEKQMLFEKDHVKPQYDETEKQLTRIATKGVVALFQAVYDQTQKMKELQHNKSISGASRDKFINDEVQSGFLELLQQASEKNGNTKTETVYVPSNRKKMTDLKSKLKYDDDLNWNDLKDLGIDLDENGDGDDVKAESISTQVAKNMTKNGLGSKHMQQDSSDSDDDDNAVPKFRRQALQRQKEQKEAQVKTAAKGKALNQRTSAATDKRVVGKWNVLDDDYVQSKAGSKMKDWENDDTSDSDL